MSASKPTSCCLAGKPSADRGLDCRVLDRRIGSGRHMVERFVQVGEDLIAVLSNGELFAAPRATLEWQPLLPDIKGVNAVTFMEDISS